MHFNWIVIPFFNYRYLEKFKDKSDEFIIEYGIHDTFDALSPTYDNPIKTESMRTIASEVLKVPFEIVKRRNVTLLRTLIKNR